MHQDDLPATGGHSVRQALSHAESGALPARYSADVSPSPAARTAGLPLLLNDREAAALLGVGRSTFYKLSAEPWFPRPVMLGPRVKRHVLHDLAKAIESMPRQTRSCDEPPQLLRGRIERMKSTGVPA